MPETIDLAIIGAGPAGSVAAALAHRAGLKVRVFEATRFPRFVIGESLLPRCMDVLETAGLLEAARGRGYLVKDGALFLRGRARCDFRFRDQFTPGWTWTWQVPRADFDQTLARAVVEMGVPIEWETRVVAASFARTPELTVVDAEGARAQVKARFVIDASGYGRVLPRLLDLEAPPSLPPRRALFTHVSGDHRPEGPEEGRIWICVHPGGAWIWIIPFADGRTSVGAVATPAFFAQHPGPPEQSLRAILDGEEAVRKRLAGVHFEFEPRAIEGYSASVKRLWGPGFCLVGNATEFLDPVFSSGVTLALESSLRATELAIRQLGGETVDWNRDYSAHMMRGIDVFRTFVDRWYDGVLPDLFFAAQEDTTVRAQICSVLAGYVWDQNNPFVREPARKVDQLARLTLAPASP